MALHFRLAEFGQTFASRGRAAELREELLSRVGHESAVVIDFEGVTNVSYSFADEFLGRLASECRLSTSQINVAPRVAQTVESAIRRRTQATVSC